MQKKEIKKVYIEKINKLKKYDRAYFDKDNPLISDGDYDNIKQEILNLEKKFKYLKGKDSLGEKVGYRRWSAVIIGFIGSLIVIRPGFIEFNLASIAALVTGFFYGIYLVITRKLHTSDNPLLTLLLTGVVGALIGSFIVPVVWINPTFNQWSLLALMGIFACLGHLFLILSLKYADASKLAPFGYFEIVTNIMLGYYFFSDFPHYWTWVGLAIIISSGIYISLRETTALRIK